MPAESAAGPGANGADQDIHDEDAAPEAGQQRSDGGSKPAEAAIHSEPIGDRMQSILGMMDLPADVRAATLGTKEEEKKPATSPEEIPAAAPKGSKAEDGELTDEQKTQWPPDALARIHKATAQREAARAEKKAEQEARERLEQENAELRQRVTSTPIMGPTPQNPLAHLQTPAQLETAEAELERWLDWTKLHPNGAVDVVIGKDAEGKEILQDFEPEDVAKLAIDVDRTLRKALPLQRDHIRARVAQEQIARQDYPELFDENTEEYKLGRLVIEQMPDLLRFPDAMLNVGIYVEGLKAYRDRKLAAQKPNNRSENPAIAAFTRPQPKRAPALPRAQRPATEPVRPDQDVAAAEEKAAQAGGSPQSMENLVRTLRAAQGGRRGEHRLTPA